MIKIEGFDQVVSQLEAERGITRSEIIEAILEALESAAKKKFSLQDYDNIKAIMKEETKEIIIVSKKEIVQTVEDAGKEISKADAQKIVKGSKIGEIIDVDITPNDFGRIAAQVAKQVIIQRIREAERKSIVDEFENKIGTILVGTVQRIEGMNYLINLGRTEAILDIRNQIPGERLFVKDRVKVYIVEIDKRNLGPALIISRSHSGFVARLFEAEVPELVNGPLHIVSIGRQAGYRTKIAVKSTDSAVGVVGTCVGRMGSRIQAVLKELGNEKVDIIECDDKPIVFINNALKPAKILAVRVIDEKNKKAAAYVADDQLSLAIGKSGLNVRLASQLTGWSIDIIKRSTLSNEEFAKIQDTLGTQGPTTSLALKMKEAIKAQQEKNEQTLEIEKSLIAREIETVIPATEVKAAKIKLHEIATALQLPAETVVEKAREFWPKIKTKANSISIEQAEILKEALSN